MKKAIEEGIKKFNHFREPEAKAELISFKEKRIKVRFSGPFCLSCAPFDYIDDLRIFFEEEGLKTEIEKVKEFEEGFMVEFKVKE